MNSHPSIGFVGLGLMGRGIAMLLLRAGYPLTVLPGPRRSSVESLVSAGASAVDNPAKLAANCDIVFTCLPSSREVETVVKGTEGLMDAAHQGFIHIDLTSADPSSTIAIAATYRNRGAHFIDAAMAGMPEQASNGDITLMVGADTELFQRVEPILRTFARKIVRTGDVGAGHRTKLIMSFIGMAIANATAEALTVAHATGTDIDALRRLVGETGMNSSTFQAMALAATDGDVSRRKLSIANALEDVNYFVDMVKRADLSTTLAPAMQSAMTGAVESGHGHEFVPALTRILCERNGLTLSASA